MVFFRRLIAVGCAQTADKQMNNWFAPFHSRRGNKGGR
jgi:hypothetical protein